MARIRTRPTPWPDKFDNDNYKDLRRGAADDAFWDEDELVDYRRIGKKKKRNRVPGCPGNDGKSHVYVWVNYDPWWHSGNIYEIRVCCGCEKRGNGFRKKQ